MMLFISSMMKKNIIITTSSSSIFSIVLLLLLLCYIIVVYIEDQEGGSSLSLLMPISSSMKKQKHWQSLRKDTNNDRKHVVQVAKSGKESFVSHDNDVIDNAHHTTEAIFEDLIRTNDILQWAAGQQRVQQQQLQQQLQEQLLLQKQRQMEVEGSEKVLEVDNEDIDVFQIIMTNNNQFEHDTDSSNQNHLYIPIQFRSDKEYYHVGTPFPRWQFFSSDNSNANIDRNDPIQNSVSIIESLIHHIDQLSRYLSQYDYIIKYTNMTQYNINKRIIDKESPVHTSDHNDIWTPGHSQPEVLYVVDGEKGIVMTSQYCQDIGDILGEMASPKSNVLHKLMSTALDLLFNKNTNKLQITDNDFTEMTIPIRWPRLHQLLVVKKGSFPFLAHYSDYIGCNYNNWNNHTESLPLFTLAANVHCNYTFPFPSHILYQSLKQNSKEWYDTMNEWNTIYPLWMNKISKVVFRGQLSGYMNENVQGRGIRWHLLNFVHNESRLTPNELNSFDIKIISEYKGHNDWIHPEEIGGISGSYHMNTVDYQNYKAILDVDGFSWSSRFGNLLCYNSVILKIEPNYVDYYYYPVHMNDYNINTDSNNNDNNNETYKNIMPWKHYIPIKSDLSDLIEKTEFAVDPANEEHILSIIHNANEWCANEFTIPKINMDVLDIWEKYVTTLDKSTELKNIYLSSNHNKIITTDHTERLLLKHEMWENQWNQMKDEVYNSSLQMLPVWYIP